MNSTFSQCCMHEWLPTLPALLIRWELMGDESDSALKMEVINITNISIV